MNSNASRRFDTEITLNRRQGNTIGFVLIILVALVVLLLLSTQSPEGRHVIKKAAAAIQPPVRVSLQPFAWLKGHYLFVGNTSSTVTLTDLNVTYTDVGGNSVTQKIPSLKPNESVMLDPSLVNWRIIQNETITISAGAPYIPKVFETNTLIQQ